MSELAAQLFRLIVLIDYKWKINGEYVTPTPKDIEETLDRAKEVLYAETIPSQFETGGLIVQHHKQGQFTIYLRIGDINDSQE